jgi:hypothetical protein
MPLASPISKPHLLYRFLKTLYSLFNNHYSYPQCQDHKVTKISDIDTG